MYSENAVALLIYCTEKNSISSYDGNVFFKGGQHFFLQFFQLQAPITYIKDYWIE